MVAHRIADPTILKLIGKWLKAGAMVDGGTHLDRGGYATRRPNYSLNAEGNFTFERVICGWRTGISATDLRLKK
jgi:hypothetical protein